MAVQHPPAGREPAITHLEGELPDQAALMGVLIALHDMQLPVLAVACLAVQSQQP